MNWTGRNSPIQRRLINDYCWAIDPSTGLGSAGSVNAATREAKSWQFMPAVLLEAANTQFIDAVEGVPFTALFEIYSGFVTSLRGAGFEF